MTVTTIIIIYFLMQIAFRSYFVQQSWGCPVLGVAKGNVKVVRLEGEGATLGGGAEQEERPCACFTK